MRTCDLFDKYRDGEASVAERNEYEGHLAACEACRTRFSMLDNLVHALRAEEIRPLDRADRIAREAFRRAHSWDYEVISWLRPGPAMTALVLALVLFASLWIVTGDQQVSAYSEYETLMNEADTLNIGTRLQQAGSDNEIMVWLEEEGTSSD